MIHLDIAKFALGRLLLSQGVSKSYASEIVNGKKKPSLELATRVQNAGGPDMSAWIDGDPLKSMWDQMRQWEVG